MSAGQVLREQGIRAVLNPKTFVMKYSLLLRPYSVI